MQLLHEVSKTNTGVQSQENMSAWNQLNASDSLELEDRLVLAKMSAQLTQIQYEKQTTNDSLQVKTQSHYYVEFLLSNSGNEFIFCAIEE